MPTYSRLSKIQQQKVLVQSIVLVVFSIAFLAVFVFVVLPLTVRIFEFLPGRPAPQAQQSNALPPQTPILFPILDATNSAQLSVAGYGEPDTLMTLYNNDVRVQEATTGKDGQFAFTDFALGEGTNALYVTSRNAENAESKSSLHEITLDTTAPALSISEPSEGAVITRRRDQVISVKGQTDPKTRAYLNGKFLFIDAAGNFSGTFQLAEGDNVLTFQAIDAAGNTTQKEVRVAFRP